MYHDEMWQEFYPNGDRIMDGGRSPKDGNPKSGEEDVWVGATVLWL